MASIGETIKKYRESNNMSKAEMGRRLGISGQLIGQYERGRQNPKPEFYIKWKQVFGNNLLKQFETNVPRETNLETAFAELRSWQLTVDATLKVIIDEVGPLLSKASGRSNAGVLAQLRKDIEAEIENRLALLKKAG